MGQERYVVRGATEKALMVDVHGNELPMAWKKLLAGSQAAMAKEAAKEGDVEGLLIAAVLQLPNGEKAQCHTLRLKLLKIGARIRVSARRILISMAEG